MAFSVDESFDEMVDYLGESRLPFIPRFLIPTKKSERTAPFASINISIPSDGIPIPFAAVLDRNGKEIGQGSGEGVLDSVPDWLDAAGIR